MSFKIYFVLRGTLVYWQALNHMWADPYARGDGSFIQLFNDA